MLNHNSVKGTHEGSAAKFSQFDEQGSDLKAIMKGAIETQCVDTNTIKLQYTK